MKRPTKFARYFWLLAVPLAFAPSLWANFVYWDDDINLYHNKDLIHFDWSSFVRLWSLSQLVKETATYRPLVYAVYGVIGLFARLHPPGVSPSGDPLVFNPWPFHLANLALHTLNAWLVYLIALGYLRRSESDAGKTRQIGAAAAGLVWAIHPLQAEPVVWVTGLTEVLAGTFGLTALLLFAASRQHAGRTAVTYYCLSTLAFLLALFAKPSAVCIPLMALAMMGVPARWNRTDVLGLAPWFVLAVGAVLVTRSAEPTGPDVFSTPLWVRPLIAADAIRLHFWHLVFPFFLGADYGEVPLVVIQNLARYASLAILTIFLLGGVWFKFPRLRVPLLVTLAGLLPVLGFVPFRFQGYSTVADRYMYVPLLGVALGVASIVDGRPSLNRAAGVILVLGTLLLGSLSFRQSLSWTDSAALWRRTLEVNPGSFVARNKLAGLAVRQGRWDEALRIYEFECQHWPHAASPWYNRGTVLDHLGQTEAAISCYRTAVNLRPDYAMALNNLGAAYASRGQLDLAGNVWRQLAELEPDNARLLFNLGLLSLNRSDLSSARAYWQQSVKADPNFSDAQRALSEIERPRAEKK